jgi:ADP-ribose pyrophosphatase YjhB (NUDIX family)
MDFKPRLGCAVIILNGNKVLLGKRAKEPHYGKWIIPGGGVKFLETYKDTAKREIFEETGLSLDKFVFYDIKEIVNPPDEHRVVIYCITEYNDDEYKPSSDLSELRFFDETEIEVLRKENTITPTVYEVLSTLNMLH